MLTQILTQNVDVERAVNTAFLAGYLQHEYNECLEYVDEMREANRKLWYPARLQALSGDYWYKKCYEVLP